MGQANFCPRLSMEIQSTAGLNDISDQLQDYIGEDGISELNEFAKHLSHQVPKNWPARLAPSAITRTETLLFDLDIPRFAVRVHFGEPGGYVNCRRTQETLNRLATAQWYSPSGINVAPNYPPPIETFRRLLASTDCVIADAVIVPPQNVLRKYILVDAELGWCYGEGCSVRGIPFARPLPGFSGAACAQAAAYMVCVLLHDHGRTSGSIPESYPGAHGLLEITAITHSGETQLPLSGLKGRQLFEYFIRTGKSPMFFQSAVPIPNGVVTKDAQAAVTKSLLLWIRAHVQSGFAPILFVKADNKDRDHSVSQPPDHAVVAVAVHKDEKLILVNDPSHLPLTRWDADELFDHCVFSESVYLANAPSPKSDYGPLLAHAMVVLPSPVRLPLTWSRISEETATYGGRGVDVDGILQIAGAYRRKNAKFVSETETEPTPDDFWLCRIRKDGDFQDRISLIIPVSLREILDESPLEFSCLAGFDAFLGRWVWIEHISEKKFRIWLAELEAPQTNNQPASDESWFERLDRYLIGTCNADTGGWSFTSSPKSSHLFLKRGIEEAEKLIHSGRNKNLALPAAADSLTHSIASEQLLSGGSTFFEQLKPSLITSTSALGLEHASYNLSSYIDSVELYAFMHMDKCLCEDFLHSQTLSSTKSTAALLSEFENSADDARENISKSLANYINSLLPSEKLKIRAISTFLPQLFSFNEDQAAIGRDAIVFLCRFMSELFALGHPVNVIELVCGSRVKGLAPICMPDGSIQLHAFCRSQGVDNEDGKTLSELLVARLVELRKQFKKLGINSDISFALELEPGPLYSLSNRVQLLDLAAAIASEPILSSNTGFNVDVAHYILANIPAAILQHASIIRRVCNFHVSDHSLGHFADLPLADGGFGRTASDMFDLKEWIREIKAYSSLPLTQERRIRKDQFPSFTGAIAVELEAAKETGEVKRSVQILRSLLGSN